MAIYKICPKCKGQKPKQKDCFRCGHTGVVKVKRKSRWQRTGERNPRRFW